MIYLAFDLGLSHTGVAISHEGILAEGLTNIEERDPFRIFSRIFDLIDKHHPDIVVLGQPSRGEINQLATKLSEELSAKYPNLKIDLFNEDRSTSLVEKGFIKQGASLHARKKRQHRAVAASLLQNYIDSQ